MNEMIAYCLVAFAPPFLLRLLAAWLPRRLQWLRWLLLLYPAALLGLAALGLDRRRARVRRARRATSLRT